MTNDLTAERWKKIKELFLAALEREADERTGFLDEVCNGDDDLRREVESLLAEHDQPDNLIDRPAFEITADLLVTDELPSAIGRIIGPYKITKQIGRGGMGEVYLAQDTRLGRRVALKLLPSHFTIDRDRLRRFKQEARAASALNHPNIITIHEVGQVDAAHFIATEFIEGHTLRSSIGEAGMKSAEAIDVAIQVASALRAAHEAGIVHRDIKPENIMVRPDGYVKVLDFGLAKLTERNAMTDDTGVSFTAIETDPGVVMGTVSYMSPEQARGLAMDERTDIFSLGVVLYEMIAGRVPFEGATMSDVIVAILEKQPPALSTYTTDAPAEIEASINKALEKKREDRYQTAKEMLDDLRKLKQDLEIQARIESSAAEELPAGVRMRASSEQASAATATAVTATNAAHITGRIKLHKRGVMIALMALLLIASVIAGVLLLAVPAKTIDSIAVMPFANASNDPNTDYLPDGVTESLINSLSLLPGLKVMARGTVFTYKGREVDPRKIGEDLKVQAVVMGRILQRGQMLTVTAELVDTSDGSQLWGKQYNTTPSEILAVQESISQDITDKLGVSDEQKKRLAKRYTENTEAYQLYLRGRYHWNKRTKDSLSKSIDYFQEAIEKDPAYGLAHAGIADAYIILGNYQYLAPADAYPKAEAAAKMALKINDTLAEAHTSLAHVKHRYFWDWAGAEAEFRRAIELNPTYPPAHQWYAILLSYMGRKEEAIEEAKLSQKLDPLSLTINSGLGWNYYFARRYNEAIAVYEKTLELDTNFVTAHGYIGMAYEAKGMHEQAIASFQKALQLQNRPEYLAWLGHVYAMSGRREKAEKMLEELKSLSRQSYVSAYHMAFLYLGLGDKDRALEHLERACEERSSSMIALKADPVFDTLHTDARFQDLMQRMGFQ